LTIGETALLIVGAVGLAVNVAALRDARRLRAWVRRAHGVRAAEAANSGIRRAALRIVASAGAVVIGGLAAATPGRFAGSGVGLGIAIVAGLVAFAAVVAASILDYRERYEFRRGVVRELMSEQQPPDARPAVPMTDWRSRPDPSG
jgi:hypothetical protein